MAGNFTAATTGGHPVLRTLVAFPVACFSGALATDVTYAMTADMLWADFSDWLLAAGMAFGVLAALAGCIAAVADRRMAPRSPVLILAVGGLMVLALGLLDNLVHSRDAWTSVVPAGLVLSAATVLAMLATIWLSAAPRRQRAVTTYRGVRT